VLALELLAIVALVLSLGSMARAWLNVWGALLAVGVVGLVLLAGSMTWYVARPSGDGESEEETGGSAPDAQDQPARS